MAGERNLWNTLKRNMQKDTRLYFQRHEDTYSVGIADVSFVVSLGKDFAGREQGVRGWMELKHVKEWPKRPATTLKLRHFTIEQRNWLRRQGLLGGRTWLLLQVDRDYLLFHWKELPLLGQATQVQLRRGARLQSKNKLAYKDLIDILTEEV